MSGISEIFRKLGWTLNSSPEKPGQKLTPNEVELMAFQERDRLDDIKQQLLKMRLKHSMLNTGGDIDIFKKQPSLLKGNTLLKHNPEPIMKNKNVFF